jgi:hypothetical protein
MDPSGVPMLTGDESMFLQWAMRLVLVGSLLTFCYLADRLWKS